MYKRQSSSKKVLLAPTVCAAVASACAALARAAIGTAWAASHGGITSAFRTAAAVCRTLRLAADSSGMAGPFSRAVVGSSACLARASHGDVTYSGNIKDCRGGAVVPC